VKYESIWIFLEWVLLELFAIRSPVFTLITYLGPTDGQELTGEEHYPEDFVEEEYLPPGSRPAHLLNAY